jgi:hypothetical protein
LIENLIVVYESEKAIKVSQNNQPTIWLPKSQIRDYGPYDNDPAGATGWAAIPAWLAREKGLT